MTHILIKSVVKGIVYATIALIAIWLYTNFIAASSAFPMVRENTYQAVFLESGQVYFGMLKDENSEYVTLRDVYYLKEASELSQSNLNLVKLGGELHGPEDTIYIRKASITFWENMKDSSRVVQTIRGSKQ